MGALIVRPDNMTLYVGYTFAGILSFLGWVGGHYLVRLRSTSQIEFQTIAVLVSQLLYQMAVSYCFIYRLCAVLEQRAPLQFLLSCKGLFLAAAVFVGTTCVVFAVAEAAYTSKEEFLEHAKTTENFEFIQWIERTNQVGIALMKKVLKSWVAYIPERHPHDYLYVFAAVYVICSATSAFCFVAVSCGSLRTVQIRVKINRKVKHTSEETRRLCMQFTRALAFLVGLPSSCLSFQAAYPILLFGLPMFIPVLMFRIGATDALGSALASVRDTRNF